MDKYQNKVLFGDALEQLKTVPDETVQMCVTSPPYWGLRDYGHEDQLGLEETPEEYVDKLTSIFNEVNRVLKDDGTLWLNLGDSYNSAPAGKNPGGFQGDQMKESDGYNKAQTRKKIKGGSIGYLKPKDLVGIPWRVAISLQKAGWYLRSDIIWHKPNPMPESVKDRPTNSHEHIFLLSKSKKYYYDWESIAEDSVTFEGRPDGIVRNREYDYDSKLNKVRGRDQKDNNIKGDIDDNGVTRTTAGLNKKSQSEKTSKKKNKRDVWSIATKPFPEAHFAVYPPELIAPCIKAGSKPKDIVLDPFYGSGTTGEVCKRLNRYYLGIELNEDYEPIQNKRTSQNCLEL